MTQVAPLLRHVGPPHCSTCSAVRLSATRGTQLHMPQASESIRKLPQSPGLITRPNTSQPLTNECQCSACEPSIKWRLWSVQHRVPFSDPRNVSSSIRPKACRMLWCGKDTWKILEDLVVRLLRTWVGSDRNKLAREIHGQIRTAFRVLYGSMVLLLIGIPGHAPVTLQETKDWDERTLSAWCAVSRYLQHLQPQPNEACRAQPWQNNQSVMVAVFRFDMRWCMNTSLNIWTPIFPVLEPPERLCHAVPCCAMLFHATPPENQLMPCFEQWKALGFNLANSKTPWMSAKACHGTRP